MELQNTFEVPLPPSEAWEVLLDIERIAPCLPGARLTEVVDERTFKGEVSVRLGPVALTFAGKATLEEIDGAPAVTDLGKFRKALGVALIYTKYVPFRFGRFADRVLGTKHSPEAEEDLKEELAVLLDKGEKLKEITDPVSSRAAFAPAASLPGAGELGDGRRRRVAAVGPGPGLLEARQLRSAVNGVRVREQDRVDSL